MFDVKYITFNQSDEILSVHKKWVKSLHLIDTLNQERFIKLENYDLRELGDLTFKKGDVVKGLYELVESVNRDESLINLMVKWLSKEIIESDKKRFQIPSGELSRAHLVEDLNAYGISFKDWMLSFEEAGQNKLDQLNAVLLEKAKKASLLRAELEVSQEHFAGASFSLPAIAGKMAVNIYYTVQVPFGQLGKLFAFNGEQVPVEMRAQRVLDEKRARAIADYIIERRLDYALPALTASVSDAMLFEPVAGYSNIGTVKIPIDATLLLNDGQHRRRAIELVIAEHPHFKDQSISVVLFYDHGLKRSQQLFSDLNNQMVKPPKALSILFDRENKLNNLVMKSINSLGISNAIEFEKSAPSSKSNKVWSVTAIKKAAEQMTGLNDKNVKTLTKDKLDYFTESFTQWLKCFIEHTQGGLSIEVEKGTSESLFNARKNRVNTHAVFLQAAALASSEISKPFNLKILNNEKIIHPNFDELKALKLISVQKDDPVWRHRIVKPDGKMNPNGTGIKLGAYVFLNAMNLSVPSSIDTLNTIYFNEDGTAVVIEN